MTPSELYVLKIAGTAARARGQRLHARMRGAQVAALRRARLGAHGCASTWWKVMIRTHLVRQLCTRPSTIIAAADRILAEVQS